MHDVPSFPTTTATFRVSFTDTIPQAKIRNPLLLKGEILVLLLLSVFVQVPILRTITLVFLFEPFGIVLELNMR